MRVFAGGACSDRLLPWVCHAGGDLPGKTCHIGVTNVEVEDLTSRSSTLLVSIPSSVPSRDFNSCPIDKESDFITKELASWVLVFCLNRLLFRALSSIPSRVYSWDPQGVIWGYAEKSAAVGVPGKG